MNAKSCVQMIYRIFDQNQSVLVQFCLIMFILVDFVQFSYSPKVSDLLFQIFFGLLIKNCPLKKAQIGAKLKS